MSDFGGPQMRETVTQFYRNDPKRLCYAIAARNRRYAEQTMARLVEIQERRALNDKELAQWRKAEKWIFDEGKRQYYYYYYYYYYQRQ